MYVTIVIIEVEVMSLKKSGRRNEGRGWGAKESDGNDIKTVYLCMKF